MTALSRNIGVGGLAAIGINMTVGVGVFVLPAAFIAGSSTGWAPLLVILVGLGLVPVSLCFAELGSRFHETGGPYLYARHAFGAPIGFLVGWLLWITRIVSHASVLVVLINIVVELDFIPLPSTVVSALIASAVTGTLWYTNYRGAQMGVGLLFLLSVLKFAPLLVLLAIGFPLLLGGDSLEALTFQGDVTWAETGILIAFGLAGFEMLTIVGGEAKNPQKNVPRALMIALIFATGLMASLTLLVSLALADPGKTDQPLIDVASLLLGPVGASFIILTLCFSVLGHNASSLIASSRILYGLAEKGDIPSVLARVDDKRGTPSVALSVCALTIIALCVSGSYLFLAALGGATRVLVYLITAAATLKLRSPKYTDLLGPSNITMIGGPLLPSMAIALCLFLLTGLSLSSFFAVALALLVGGIFYLFNIQKQSHAH